MVIGERFVWGHLQKTGGHATVAMFELFPEIVLFADPMDSDDSHTPFNAREEQLRGKSLVMNMRRLPHWTLSWAQHRFTKRPNPRPFESPELMASIRRADWRLSAMIDKGRIRIDRWLRVESLADDFIDVVSEFAEVDSARRDQIHKLGERNALQYDHDIFHWFTPRQIETMYRNNPLWASVEREVYGNLLSEGVDEQQGRLSR
jgi:hypothetical protein